MRKARQARSLLVASSSNQIPTSSNVMVVSWNNLDITCLEDRALYHDVLLVSIKNNYVWILHTVPSDGVVERCGTVHEKEEFIIDFRYRRFILAYDMGQYIMYEQMSRQSRSIYDAATKLIRDNDNWLLLFYCAQESISNVCQTFQSFRIFTMRIIDKKRLAPYYFHLDFELKVST